MRALKTRHRRVVSINIAIIGGAGRMGRWLTQYFHHQGHKVSISDVKLDDARAVAKATGVEFVKNNVEAVKTTDLIMVSTPIPIIPKVIHEIAPYVSKGAIVAEISSLKSHVMKTLVETARLNVRLLSIHPLFGPRAQKLKGRKIAVIPILNPEVEKRLVEEFFPEAEIIVVDVEDHDRAMALTLSLSHFMNIAFASIISNEDLVTLKKLEGPTFKLQLALAESVMTEDPTLQASIQMNNEYGSQYLNKFLTEANIIKKWITEKDEEKFGALLYDLHRRWFKSRDTRELMLKAIS